MRRGLLSRLRGQSGQSVVEFGMVVPEEPLLLLLLLPQAASPATRAAAVPIIAMVF